MQSQGCFPFLLTNFGGRTIPEFCHTAIKKKNKKSPFPQIWKGHRHYSTETEARLGFSPCHDSLCAFTSCASPFLGLETRHCASLPLQRGFKMQCCTKGQMWLSARGHCTCFQVPGFPDGSIKTFLSAGFCTRCPHINRRRWRKTWGDEVLGASLGRERRDGKKKEAQWQASQSICYFLI